MCTSECTEHASTCSSSHTFRTEHRSVHTPRLPVSKCVVEKSSGMCATLESQNLSPQLASLPRCGAAVKCCRRLSLPPPAPRSLPRCLEAVQPWCVLSSCMIFLHLAEWISIYLNPVQPYMVEKYESHKVLDVAGCVCMHARAHTCTHRRTHVRMRRSDFRRP